MTPWNIKQEKSGECAVIDWENANISGLPLWDLCHFYFIQAHLFNEAHRIKKFMALFNQDNSLIYEYINSKKITACDAKKLVILYVLDVVLNKNTSDSYRTFLLNQISMVINK